eukprot:TRINITY_DN38374_c0_g1_i1.p1 TRINITY_DN38374_c0_g1~~TRINITY_DN38374_c0_g1_i1.p1  ORF type:complete len:1980 (-),score=598.79 TRINITY_DN38374_c0_g1_i1:62-6001(-)
MTSNINPFGNAARPRRSSAACAAGAAGSTGGGFASSTPPSVEKRRQLSGSAPLQSGCDDPKSSSHAGPVRPKPVAPVLRRNGSSATSVSSQALEDPAEEAEAAEAAEEAKASLESTASETQPAAVGSGPLAAGGRESRALAAALAARPAEENATKRPEEVGEEVADELGELGNASGIQHSAAAAESAARCDVESPDILTAMAAGVPALLASAVTARSVANSSNSILNAPETASAEQLRSRPRAPQVEMPVDLPTPSFSSSAPPPRRPQSPLAASPLDAWPVLDSLQEEEPRFSFKGFRSAREATDPSASKGVATPSLARSSQRMTSESVSAEVPPPSFGIPTLSLMAANAVKAKFGTTAAPDNGENCKALPCFGARQDAADAAKASGGGARKKCVGEPPATPDFGGSKGVPVARQRLQEAAAAVDGGPPSLEDVKAATQDFVISENEKPSQDVARSRSSSSSESSPSGSSASTLSPEMAAGGDPLQGSGSSGQRKMPPRPMETEEEFFKRIEDELHERDSMLHWYHEELLTHRQEIGDLKERLRTCDADLDKYFKSLLTARSKCQDAQEAERRSQELLERCRTELAEMKEPERSIALRLPVDISIEAGGDLQTEAERSLREEMKQLRDELAAQEQEQGRLTEDSLATRSALLQAQLELAEAEMEAATRTEAGDSQAQELGKKVEEMLAVQKKHDKEQRMMKLSLEGMVQALGKEERQNEALQHELAGASEAEAEEAAAAQAALRSREDERALETERDAALAEASDKAQRLADSEAGAQALRRQLEEEVLRSRTLAEDAHERLLATEIRLRHSEAMAEEASASSADDERKYSRRLGALEVELSSLAAARDDSVRIVRRQQAEIGSLQATEEQLQQNLQAQRTQTAEEHEELRHEVAEAQARLRDYCVSEERGRQAEQLALTDALRRRLHRHEVEAADRLAEAVADAQEELQERTAQLRIEAVEKTSQEVAHAELKVQIQMAEEVDIQEARLRAWWLEEAREAKETAEEELQRQAKTLREEAILMQISREELAVLREAFEVQEEDTAQTMAARLRSAEEEWAAQRLRLQTKASEHLAAVLQEVQEEKTLAVTALRAELKEETAAALRAAEKKSAEEAQRLLAEVEAVEEAAAAEMRVLKTEKEAAERNLQMKARLLLEEADMNKGLKQQLEDAKASIEASQASGQAAKEVEQRLEDMQRSSSEGLRQKDMELVFLQRALRQTEDQSAVQVVVLREEAAVAKEREDASARQQVAVQTRAADDKREAERHMDELHEELKATRRAANDALTSRSVAELMMEKASAALADETSQAREVKSMMKQVESRAEQVLANSELAIEAASHETRESHKAKAQVAEEAKKAALSLQEELDQTTQLAREQALELIGVKAELASQLQLAAASDQDMQKQLREERELQFARAEEITALRAELAQEKVMREKLQHEESMRQQAQADELQGLRAQLAAQTLEVRSQREASAAAAAVCDTTAAVPLSASSTGSPGTERCFMQPTASSFAFPAAAAVSLPKVSSPPVATGGYPAPGFPPPPAAGVAAAADNPCQTGGVLSPQMGIAHDLGTVRSPGRARIATFSSAPEDLLESDQPCHQEEFTVSCNPQSCAWVRSPDSFTFSGASQASQKPGSPAVSATEPLQEPCTGLPPRRSDRSVASPGSLLPKPSMTRVVSAEPRTMGGRSELQQQPMPRADMKTVGVPQLSMPSLGRGPIVSGSPSAAKFAEEPMAAAFSKPLSAPSLQQRSSTNAVAAFVAVKAAAEPLHPQAPSKMPSAGQTGAFVDVRPQERIKPVAESAAALSSPGFDAWAREICQATLQLKRTDSTYSSSCSGAQSPPDAEQHAEITPRERGLRGRPPSQGRAVQSKTAEVAERVAKLHQKATEFSMAYPVPWGPPPNYEEKADEAEPPHKGNGSSLFSSINASVDRLLELHQPDRCLEHERPPRLTVDAFLREPAAAAPIVGSQQGSAKSSPSGWSL